MIQNVHILLAWISKARHQFLRHSVSARDLRRINAAADRLNAECLDVLEDQALS